MTERKYLPTLADLVDRLSITLMKSIFISDHAAEYRAELALIIHDIDLAIGDMKLGAQAIHAVLAIMLTNREIWLHESLARSGGDQQDKLLKFTHSLNGQRNAAKNVLAGLVGERKDWKIDALSSKLIDEFGQWQIFS